MITIKRIDGTPIMDVQERDDSKYTRVLMGEHSVRIRFDWNVFIPLPYGSYIEWRGSRFSLWGEYIPVQREGAFEYDIPFEAEERELNNYLFFYLSAGKMEHQWKLTAPIEQALREVQGNLDRIHGKGAWVIRNEVGTTPTKLLEFDSTSVFDALTKIAEAYGTEWRAEGRTLFFGRMSEGERVRLSLGGEASRFEPQGDTAQLISRLYAFGSTRNVKSGKRLTLPDDTPFISGTLRGKEAVKIFDDVYPKYNGTITSVSFRSVKEGNIYTIADSALKITQDKLLAGQTLKATFESGALNGLTFDLSITSQGYEIVPNNEYGGRLPSDTLKPAVGDKYVPHGFDIDLVGKEYVPRARTTLKEKAFRWLQENNEDTRDVEVVLNPIAVAERSILITIGKPITLVNALAGGDKVGYITKMEYPLYSPESVTIVVGKAKPLGFIERLKQEGKDEASQIVHELVTPQLNAQQKAVLDVQAMITDADTNATAKTTQAVNDVKAYADNKAREAQTSIQQVSNALNTAKSELQTAQRIATEAKAQADNTYTKAVADGKISEAEKRATAQAESKANNALAKAQEDSTAKASKALDDAKAFAREEDDKREKALRAEIMQDYLRQVIKDGSTLIKGGLLATNVIALKSTNGKVSSYIDGNEANNIAFATGVTDAFTADEKRAVEITHDGNARFGQMRLNGHDGVLSFAPIGSAESYLNIGGVARELDSLLGSTFNGDDRSGKVDFSLVSTQGQDLEQTEEFIGSMNIPKDGTAIKFSGNFHIEVDQAFREDDDTDYGRYGDDRDYWLNREHEEEERARRNRENLKREKAMATLEIILIKLGERGEEVKMKILNESRSYEDGRGHDTEGFTASTTLEKGVYKIIARCTLLATGIGTSSTKATATITTDLTQKNAEVHIGNKAMYAVFGRENFLHVSEEGTTIKGKTDMPGVLAAGIAKMSGSVSNAYGAKVNRLGYNGAWCERQSDNSYKVYHSIGHSNYSVQVTVFGNSRDAGCVMDIQDYYFTCCFYNPVDVYKEQQNFTYLCIGPNTK